MRGANKPDEGKIGFRPLEEAEHRRDRAFASGCTLTVAQDKSLLLGGLECMKFPVMIGLGYYLRSQRGG